MKRHKIIKMLEKFEMIDVNGSLGIPPKQYNSLAFEIEQLILNVVVNCVYVVTDTDNYGQQLFKEVFKTKEQAIKYLQKQGLEGDNINEINEIELD